MGKLLYPQMQNREWLYDNYVRQGKTMRNIANEIGTNPCVVLDSLRKFKVPVRGPADHIRGVKFSTEHRTKISIANKGKSKPWFIGSKNPNWQGGRTNKVQFIRTTVSYNNWKEFVFNRDVLCVNCGSDKNRVSHHIKPYQEYPELRFDVNNGVVLCRSCHSTYHSSLPRIKRLIRRTSTFVDNAEPAREIAQGSLVRV